jgi:hypothetical protein
MKLWKATVEVQVCIASEQEPDDGEIKDCAEKAIADSCDSYGAEEITSFDDIPEDWRDCEPYQGGSGGRYSTNERCEHFVEAAIKAHELAAWNAPMPNQMALPIAEDVQ